MVINFNRVSIFLFVLSVIVYFVMRMGIGDLFFFARIDVLFILFINILSLLLIYLTNFNKYYILLFQSSSLLVTPILNHIYGYWKRPFDHVNLARCNLSDLNCVIKELNN